MSEEIRARADESADAVQTLRHLLSLPIGFYISIQQLKIDAIWDPIRNDPGFQKLLLKQFLISNAPWPSLACHLQLSNPEFAL